MGKRLAEKLGGDHEVIVLGHGLELEIVQPTVDDAAFGEPV